MFAYSYRPQEGQSANSRPQSPKDIFLPQQPRKGPMSLTIEKAAGISWAEIPPAGGIARDGRAWNDSTPWSLQKP